MQGEVGCDTSSCSSCCNSNTNCTMSCGNVNNYSKSCGNRDILPD